MARRAAPDVELVWAGKYDVAEPGPLPQVVETGHVGDVADGNTVFVGDSLDALRVMCEVPEYAQRYRGKVKLVYIDPPFNTGQTFAHYDDCMGHATWLSFMRERLLLIRELLAPDGSVWVHLDDAEVHRMRCLLDEVFGAQNFIASLVWEKTRSPRMDAKAFSSAIDTVLVYAKSFPWVSNKTQPAPEEKDFPFIDDDGRRYSRRSLQHGGKNSLRADRPGLWYPLTAPDGTEVWPIRPSGVEGCWRWGPERVAAEASRLEWVGRDGIPQPYVKSYLDEGKRPVPPLNLWLAESCGSTTSGNAEVKRLFPGRTVFSTPKPERLLERVIHIASDPGDLVVDCFAGSGTTAAVAHKMGRRWATVELSPATVADFVTPRLTKVVEGTDPGGVTEKTGWTGGGGFRVVAVEPS